MRFFLTSIFLTSMSLCFGQWQPTGGPEGGPVSDIVQVNGQIFIKTFNAGVFKLLENDEVWENKIIEPNTGVQKLVSNQGILYAALQSSGMYISNDLGENWVSINTEDTEDKNFNNFIVRNEKIFAANGAQGIYYTLDGGDSWSEVDNEEINTMRFNDFEIFENVIYAGGDFLYKSVDNGVNWEKVDIPELDVNGIRELTATESNIYIGGGSGQLLISPNGNEWEELSLNTFASITSMDVKGDSVLVSTSQGRVFISIDEGTTWELIQNNETSGFSKGIAIRQDNILMIADEGVYSSVDNGTSWVLMNSGLLSTFISSLISFDGSLFGSNASLGVFKSSDNGDNWEIIDNGLDGLDAKSVKKIISVGEKILIGTGSEAYITQDQGENWEVTLDPRPGKPTLAIGEDNGKIAIGVNTVGVYVSTDTAKTWMLTETSGLNLQTGYEDVLLIGDTIALSTAGGEIFMSENLGQSWRDASIPDGFYFTYSLHYHNKILYAATARGLLKSTDLGRSWDFAVNDSQSIQDIYIEGNTIYAASENGVLITTTKRQEWTAVNEGIEGQYINTIMSSDDGNLYIGTYSRSVWKRPINQLNVKPLILEQVRNIESSEDQTFVLEISDVEVDDDNIATEDFSLAILSGENYTFEELTITPAENYFGNLSIPVTVSDGQLESEPFQVVVTILPVNDPPKINDQTAISGNQDTLIPLNLNQLMVTDVDNEYPVDFTLNILSGENYTVVESAILPSEKFLGILSVPVTVNDGELDSQPFNLEITIDEIVGLLDKYATTDILIYPNPASNRLFVKDLRGESNIYTYNIYSQHGELLKNYQNTSLSEGIDISDLSNGIFSIVIYNSDKTRAIKFIKE